MSMYKIHVQHNGECNVECRVQDGTEHWTEPNIDKAYESLISAAWTMNGTRINRAMIAVNPPRNFEPNNVVTASDKKLLHEIYSGHKRVLDFDDFRLKANLLEEEVNLIYAIREGRAKVIYRD